MYRKGMPFTEEDVQRARNVNLVEYLESCGVELKRKGRMICLKEHDSLVIDPVNSKWHWNSHDLHGTNAVDFRMTYDNRTFPEAIPTITTTTATSKISMKTGR